MAIFCRNAQHLSCSDVLKLSSSAEEGNHETARVPVPNTLLVLGRRGDRMKSRGGTRRGHEEGATDPTQRPPGKSNDRRARTSHLSAINQWTIIECLKNGSLQKHKGSWRGSPDGKAISGNTIANLSCDGLLAVVKSKQTGFARLTERGEWFARTLIASYAHEAIE